MILKQSNLQYDSNIPYFVGDRRYGQDIVRDQQSLLSRMGSAIRGMTGQDNFLLSGGIITQGSTFSLINIEELYAILKTSVEVPDDFSTLPPTKKSEDIIMPTYLAAQSDFSLSTATLDGVTTNYVKIAYQEIDGQTRQKAKKTGTYVYEVQPSILITIDDIAPTSYEVAIATLVGNGSSTLVITNIAFPYTINTGEWDFIIDSDASLSAFATSTDTYENVLVKKGVWTYTGEIDLNNTGTLLFQGVAGAILSITLNPSVGSGTLIAIKGPAECAIKNIQLDLTHNHNAPVRGIYGFRGGAEDLVFNCDGPLNVLSAFYGVFNINNCVITITNVTTNDAYGLHNCYRAVNGTITIQATTATSSLFCLGSYGSDYICNFYVSVNGHSTYVTGKGFAGSYITNCEVVMLDLLVGYGFDNCDYISSCRANVTSSVVTGYGFYLCNQISSCRAEAPDYAFNTCSLISSTYALGSTASNTYISSSCNFTT